MRFSWKPAAVAVIGLAALGQHLYATYHWSGYSYDQLIQMSAARSYREGHGFAVVQVFPPDPKLRDYRSVAGMWPPGYSWALGSVLRWDGDIIHAAAVLDLVAVALLFLSCWFLLQAMHPALGYGGRAAVLAWWGVASSPLRFLSTAEALALAFLSAGLAVTMRVFGPGRRRLLAAAAGGLLLGATGTMRYAYWPLLVVIPGVLAWFAWRTGARRLMWAAGVHLGAAAAVTGGIAAYQLYAIGSPVWHVSVDRKLYVSQLLSMAPFPAAMLGFDDLVRRALHADLPVTAAVWCISAGILAVCAWEAWRRLKANTDAGQGGDARDLPVQYLFVCAALMLLITVAFLLYLTLRHLRHEDGFVFVNEVRYYAPGFLFLYLGLAAALVRLVRRTPRIGIGIMAGIVLLGCLSASRWIHSGSWRFLEESPYRLSNRVFATVLTGEARHWGRAGEPVVYADTDQSRLLTADVVGMFAMPARTWTEGPPLRTEGVSLLIGCRGGCGSPGLAALRDRLERQGARRAQYFGNFELTVWSQALIH
jgi:hypothetical protein